MSAARSLSLVEQGNANRAIEAKLEELKAEQARLMSRLSAPRAARLREMEKAAAYGLVLEDVKRLADRARGVKPDMVAQMEGIAQFVAHRQQVMA